MQSVPVTLRPHPGPAGAAVRRRAVARGTSGAYVDELLKLAAQHGVTGRSTPVRRRRGPTRRSSRCRRCTSRRSTRSSADDLDGAVAAYQQALKENPADADATLGLAQVG